MTDIILFVIAFYLDWKLGLAVLGLVVIDAIIFLNRTKKIEADHKKVLEILKGVENE